MAYPRQDATNYALSLPDLPNEVLGVVLQYLGYTHQQRLSSVCRRWNYMVTTELEHVYLEVASQYARPASRPQDGKLFEHLEQRSTRPVGEPMWHREWQAVRQLTVNGRLVTSLPLMAYYMVIMAERFPALQALNITQVVITWCPFTQLKPFMAKRPAVRVALLESVVQPLPNLYENAGRSAEIVVMAEEHKDCYVRVPDFILTDLTELGLVIDRAIWPYPAEQTEWLARNAPCLNESPLLVQRLGVILRFVSIMGCSFAKVESKLCEEHGKFCEHLDASFYRNQLDGQARNLLALCILQLNSSTSNQAAENPPFPFKFQTH